MRPGAPATNAIRVELSREVPLFFGSFLVDSDVTIVRARATAARTDVAAFELNSQILNISGGIPGRVLSQLAGVDLALSDDDIAALATGQIDVIDFAEQLRGGQGDATRTFGEAFGLATPLDEVLTAMANSAQGAETRAILLQVAGNAGNENVTMADLIDLGPFKTADVNDGRSTIEIDAYSLLRSVLQLSHGDSYDVSLDTDLAGGVPAHIRVSGGYGYARSPWLTIASASEYVLRTAQTRIYLETGLTSGNGLPVSLRVPLYVELAPAEAQINDILCTGNPAEDGVGVDVRPSLGTLAVADIDESGFADFSRDMSMGEAVMADTALLDITGFAKTDMGGEATQQLFFDKEEIARREHKIVSTSDLAEVLVDTLLGNLDLTVQTAAVGIPLGSSALGGEAIATTVGDRLADLAPAIDATLHGLTTSLGVNIGAAEVGVTYLRCGQPSIVG
ncbi:MAG: hypothetical protein IE933_04510 [Sphingomonadales bacterium]|nr:hypothetical protein [Sphingomonadales bacterium]MBD3774459.1 hypothetical protein [Paracoccaceae bacterium]